MISSSDNPHDEEGRCSKTVYCSHSNHVEVSQSRSASPELESNVGCYLKLGEVFKFMLQSRGIFVKKRKRCSYNTSRRLKGQIVGQMLLLIEHSNFKGATSLNRGCLQINQLSMRKF